MGKRMWKVEWASRPSAESAERLAQAVRWVIDRGMRQRARPRRVRADPSDARPNEIVISEEVDA